MSTPIEILWTNAAIKSFDKIIEYLEANWTPKEVKQLIEATTQFLSVLQSHPEMCRPSQKRKHVRIGILNKQTQLIYHYKPRKHQIVVLLFWAFKQNPDKLRY
ncbi:type II toxin-antitoxin system RelE/ParE family toxin [Deminuibacter soli]|uniref:type II toxin-antitoxin system RelE/ParE family toxin n=1 Tax=Deminuibacter soli TaxID=2291815 RepID=UPI001313FDFA|nr:type II toxin-antitoxin system RelE/ParE family toxin [Deminuibacter soli]